MDGGKRVTNVVDENMKLKAENREAQDMIKTMQEKIKVLNEKLASQPASSDMKILQDTDDISE